MNGIATKTKNKILKELIEPPTNFSSKYQPANIAGISTASRLTISHTRNDLRNWTMYIPWLDRVTIVPPRDR